MLFAVDIGNTNIVIGIFKDESLLHRWRLDTHTRKTEDEWQILLKSLFSDTDLSESDISGAAVSSVVPDVTPYFVSISKNLYKVVPVMISGLSAIGMPIKTDDPLSVGADRLCNAVAGYEKYGGPLIIIDFGTATTFDIVSQGGEYIGGIISPGFETAAQHLHMHAAKLPSVELQFPDTIIAKNTEKSMQVGILYGAVGSVEGIISRIKEELQSEATVIATGGLAPVIKEKTDVIQYYEPDLTMTGIEKIYRRIIKSSNN